MAASNDLRELVHRKQIEILRAVEDAIEQQHLELWRLRKNLQDALQRVDSLLEIDGNGETTRPPAAAVTVLTPRYPEVASAPAAKGSGERFPQA